MKIENFGRDYRQSEEYGRYMESLGWKVEKLSTCRAYVKHLGPVSLIKIQRPDSVDLEEARDLHNKLHSIHTRIDLLNDNHKFKCQNSNDKSNSNVKIQMTNFRQSSPHLPSLQHFIDLTKTEADLLKDMNYERRRSLEKSLKNNLSIEVVQKDYDEPLKQFTEFWQKEAKRRGDWFYNTREVPAIFKAFSPNAYIFNINSKSSALFISHEDTFVYLFAATTNEGRQLYASTYLLWQAILFAKKMGFAKMDMGSLYDPRLPNQWQSWKGFSHFKRGFGGYEVEYPTYCLKVGLPI